MKLLWLVLLVIMSTSLKAQVTLQAQTFPGADASIQINACIAAVIVAGGGVCDSTALGGSQAMSQQISLGSAVQASTLRMAVELDLPLNAKWHWHGITDGTSCAIYQYNNTTLKGNGVGAGANRSILTVDSGSNMRSIYCTDQPANGANYIRAEGFAVENSQPNNIFSSGGIIDIWDLVDNSYYGFVFGENYYPGDVWHVNSACCGVTFENIQGTSTGAPGIPQNKGGIPLVLGGGHSVNATTFISSNFNAPGPGSPSIKIKGSSGYGGILFLNTYVEGNGRVNDFTTPVIDIGQTCGQVTFEGGQINTEVRFPFSSTQPLSNKPVIHMEGESLSITGLSVVNAAVGIVAVNHSTNPPTVTTVPVTITHNNAPDANGNIGYIARY